MELQKLLFYHIPFESTTETENIGSFNHFDLWLVESAKNTAI